MNLDAHGSELFNKEIAVVDFTQLSWQVTGQQQNKIFVIMLWERTHYEEQGHTA